MTKIVLIISMLFNLRSFDVVNSNKKIVDENIEISNKGLDSVISVFIKQLEFSPYKRGNYITVNMFNTSTGNYRIYLLNLLPDICKDLLGEKIKDGYLICITSDFEASEFIKVVVPYKCDLDKLHSIKIHPHDPELQAAYIYEEKKFRRN